MKKTAKYLLFTLFTIFASCSSSDDDSFNNDGIGDETPTSTSYWPHAVGNKWHFENANDQQDTFVHHIYKTINYEGKTYFQVEPLNTSEDTELTGGTREDNGIFYELHGATSMSGVNTSAGTIKSINTNLNVGEKWTDQLKITISGAASGVIQHTNEGRIVEKETSTTIKGKTYKNVLKTELVKTIYNSLSGISIKIKYEDWLAKGVGPIYRKTTYYYNNDEEIEQYELTNYSLK